MKEKCLKCDGEGWVWGHELDEYDEENAPTPDDTKYTCDECKGKGYMNIAENNRYNWFGIHSR